MKIAVLYDIHGNVAALDAVLADAASRQVNQIVNLGDICSGGLFLRETADRLVSLNLPTNCGNHKRQLMDQPRGRMGPSDRHAADTLLPEQLAWLAALPPTMRLSDDVLLVHGTPDSDLTYFLETVTEDGLREATREEVEQREGSANTDVILCGHTHLQRVLSLDDGCMIVNPGRVGLPAYDDDRPYAHLVESGSPHAHYAVLSKQDDGWTAELLSVEYDWEQAARDAEINGRLDRSRALRTGRV
ncbi:metallophosphoesterase family protein [Sphingomonas paucimobilis]|uniref:Metallophosphoesterase family protein n=1 Tax=Sphingomonas paucimobilis TaxID=13689 RepID=A0A7Y2PAU7_SPHPI|nr:metallophosphoesterase family protein [Sphingomonas paucimobilis]EPE61877.1 calcineurin-like phosphoesterase family protein [Exiguobacterium sp. S17]MCM3681729.1 metallophosphatase family protein [Sphingomonas paucimobilis]NNG56001.1 metallophosphoesterase family protein [Sphingomonas paucimobilis]